MLKTALLRSLSLSAIILTSGCSLFYPFEVVSYADDMDVPYDVAEYRIKIQFEIGRLNGLLLKDKENFAGLFIQHKPTYSINVLYKNDENTQQLDDFIAQKSWRKYVKVQKVSFSLEELKTAQKELGRLMTEIKIRYSSSIDVKRNQVLLDVLNKQAVEKALIENQLKLSKVVTINTVSAFTQYE